MTSKCNRSVAAVSTASTAFENAKLTIYIISHAILSQCNTNYEG